MYAARVHLSDWAVALHPTGRANQLQAMLKLMQAGGQHRDLCSTAEWRQFTHLN
jgi:hypothetical protein